VHSQALENDAVHTCQNAIGHAALKFPPIPSSCNPFPFDFPMARYTLCALLLFAAVAAAAGATTDADDILIRQVVPEGEVEDHLLNAEHHFATFKAKFGKTYATKEEHDHRFGVFKSNLRRARLHAQLDPSAVHGVTRFSDLTPAEFHRQFLGLKPLRLPAHAQKAPILPTNNLPKDFDWRDKGAVTNVKDQVLITIIIIIINYLLLLFEDFFV